MHVSLDMKRSAKYSICFLLCLMATACGGGGGGGSTASTPPSGTAQEPPSLPAPTYQGQTTPAQLSPFVAGQVSAFVFADVDITISFSENLINPFLSASGSGPINSTQSGPAGGEVTLNGYVNTQNDAWVVENFTNYAFVPSGAATTVTLNGQLLVEVSGSTVSFGYTNYSIQGTGFDTVLSGNASQQGVLGNGSSGQTTTTLNLGILDHNAGIDEEFVNFTLISVNGSRIGNSNETIINRTFSGRVFDSAVGYIDIATQGTQYYSPDPTKLLPLYGANVLVSGSSNTTPLLVGPLNYYFFSVGISTQNNGVFDASARYNWSSFTADTTPASVGTGPVAIAEEASSPAVSAPIYLDGRFSHSPSGDYLRMQWSLLYSTPGSHPVLTDSNLPQATLTTDKSGDYLVLLTVSDGSQTSEDTVIVRIPSNNTPTESFPMVETIAGPDVTASIGTRVLLDGRASFDAFDDGNAPTYDWQLIAPPGSMATLSDPTSAQPSFTPDVPGYYHVLLNFSTAYLNTYESASAQSLTVTVGEPIAFRPPVNFDGSYIGYFDTQFVITDINGDGQADVLFFPVTGNLGSNSVNFYLNTGSGTFASPVLLSAPGNADGGLYATVGDLNGDGRPDIIVSGVNTSGQSAVFVFLGNPGGSFSAPATYTYGTSANFYPSPVAVGHLFGSSTLSVLSDDYVFPVNSDGTLQAPSVLSVPPFTGNSLNDQFALIDFNDDGLADIVSSNLYIANSNQTFSLFNDQGYSSTYTANVADLYNDGHSELTIAGQGTLQVFSESGTNPANYPLTLVNPQSIGVGDVNGDGLSDIVLEYGGDCNTYGSGACIYDLGLFFQQVNHSFGSEALLPLDGVGGSGAIWVGDLNGDGVPDLVYMSSGQPVVQLGYKP